jgi:hypothetical protein
MRLGRPRRPGRALAALVIVAAISAAVRGIWVNGVFSSVKPGFSGTCQVIASLPGVQDMEAAEGSLFLSVGSARGPGPQDGIYAMPLAGRTPVKLAGAPKDFHPRGIGLFRMPDTGALLLYAVNRRTNGRFNIDSFEVKDPGANPALVAQGTIGGGLLINPQDVAVAGPNIFFVANGTAGKNPLIHGLQTYGIIPGGNVLYFNGTTFSEVADGLYGTRSLLLTGDHLIVGGLLSRSLTTFTREPFTGQLTEDDTLNLSTAPEKLSLDAQGQVLVASHANLLEWRAAAADRGKRAASQILRVSVANGVPQTPGQVYGNDGSQLAGASVAVAAANRLLIGSSLDGRLLSCTQK